MYCTGFYPNLSRIWKRRTEFYSRSYVKRDCESADFHETRACLTLRKEPLIKFHENPTNGLDDDTGHKRTDRLTDVASTLVVFLLTYSMEQSPS